MRVGLKEITGAINKVKSLAEGTKKTPGVMFEISDENLSICYSDGRKSIIERMGIIDNTENVIEGRLVFNLKQIASVIDMCQPSGAVYTDELNFSMAEGNRIRIEGDKKVDFEQENESWEDDDTAENIENESKVESKIVSKMQYMIVYNRPEDNIQYGVLSRMDYEGIFEMDSYDTWSIEELKDILERTCGEKNKTIYVSSVIDKTFVVNLAYVTSININACEDNGMTIRTDVAKAIVDIISKFPGKELMICVKNSRYANIVSMDGSIGLWFEMSPASRTDLSTLQRYESKGYDKYRLFLNRPVLQNVVQCALALDDNDRTNITFQEVGDNMALRIVNNNSKSSSLNDFSVILDGYYDTAGDILELKIPIGLKIISDMLSKSVEDYVEIQIEKEDNTIFLKLVDISDGGMATGTVSYTIASK